MNSYWVLDIRLKCPSPGDALLVDAVLGWQCYIKEWQGVAGNSVVTLHFGDPSTHRSKMFATFLWQMQSYRSCLLYSRGHKTSLSSWVGNSYCINSKKGSEMYKGLFACCISYLQKLGSRQDSTKCALSTTSLQTSATNIPHLLV